MTNPKSQKSGQRKGWTVENVISFKDSVTEGCDLKTMEGFEEFHVKYL